MIERQDFPTIATEVELEEWGSADLFVVRGSTLPDEVFWEQFDAMSLNFSIETGGGIFKGDNLWFCMDGDVPVAVIGASESEDKNALVIQSIYVQGGNGDEKIADYRQCHVATKLIDTVIDHALTSEINNYASVDVSDALWKTEIVLARMLPRLEREGKVNGYSSYRQDEHVGGSYHCLTLNK